MAAGGGGCIPACTGQGGVYPSMGVSAQGGGVCPGREVSAQGGVCLGGMGYLSWGVDVRPPVKILPCCNFVADGNI